VLDEHRHVQALEQQRRYAPAQNWTLNPNGTITIDGGCLDITGAKPNCGPATAAPTGNGNPRTAH
jgi:hypothetical protein